VSALKSGARLAIEHEPSGVFFDGQGAGALSVAGFDEHSAIADGIVSRAVGGGAIDTEFAGAPRREHRVLDGFAVFGLQGDLIFGGALIGHSLSISTRYLGCQA
jgi:hypothetical protein